MKAILVAMVLAAVGCGGGDEEDRLTGTWGLELDASCVFVAGFEHGADYATSTLCLLEDGTYGSETETGFYSADGRNLTTEPKRTSCPPAAIETVGYEVTASRLTITLPGGVLLLSKIPPSNGGTAIIRHGCWADDGLFYPGQLVDL
jgi:hypothetical protein